VNNPDATMLVQCYTRDGSKFQPLAFSMQAATVRAANGARYAPMADVAQLRCGQAVSCSVGTTTINGSEPQMLADG